MHRVTLAALIVSLGMLVDNAIVITEGIMIRIKKGEDKLSAAKKVVLQTKWALFGATLISILAFAAIGTSNDATGEFCGSLFHVIMISLGISWVAAITLTPLLCFYFFNKKQNTKQTYNPYNSWLFRIYRKSLEICLHFRKLTISLMIILLVLCIFGFRFVDKTFFPASARSQFIVEFWLPKGSNISETVRTAANIEKFIKKQSPHITDISTFIGRGATRFFISYTPELNDPSYAMMLVSVDNISKVPKIVPELQKKLDTENLNYLVNVKQLILGPGQGGKIQVRISGHDPKVIRTLSNKAVNIMRNTAGAKAIRTDWREKTKVIQPIFLEEQAKRAGLTYQDLSKAILENFKGITVGCFRQNDEILPIIARAPDLIRNNIINLEKITIWSNQLQQMVPIGQIVKSIDTIWEDPVIMHRNRLYTVTIHCDPETISASSLRNKLLPKIENVKLPSGYTLEWGGEFEDTSNAQAALFLRFPVFIIMIIIIIIFLFNSLKHTLIILLTVPFIIIGVTVGLLSLDQSFGFMALLGLLSLIGMQIKNSIVLLDEINFQRSSGKEILPAIIDSSVTRIRPVSMAAFTTILGMAPLLMDTLFGSMAVTIMFGLAFACILTLYIVPILYSLFFKANTKRQNIIRKP